ncbi:MAG: bactofilin family protein [Anaerolineae bacterium]
MSYLRKRWLWALIAFLCLVGVLAGVAAVPVAATEFRSGDAVTVGRDEVINDDLVVSANSVLVEGTVNGDLIAFGSQVTVTGTVSGSCALAGQRVLFNGRVNGSLYAAAASVTLGGQAAVGRNVYAAGYGVAIERGAVVTRDVSATGYQVLVNGRVQNNVRSASQAFELNGQVGNDVIADVGEPGPAPMGAAFIPGAPTSVPPGIRVGPEATIGGRLIYRSIVNQNAAIQAQPEGGVSYQEQAAPTPQPTAPPTAAPATPGTPQATVPATPSPVPTPTGPTAGEQVGNYFLGRLREFVTLFALGALALWLLRRPYMAAVDKVRRQPLPALGWGFVVIVVGYVALFIVLLILFIVGIVLALLTLGSLAVLWFSATVALWGLVFTVFHALVFYGSILIVSFLVGRWLLHYFSQRAAANAWWSLLVGVVLYVFVRTIPLAGWIIAAIAALIGTGAIFLLWRDRGRITPTTACAPAPPEMPMGSREPGGTVREP